MIATDEKLFESVSKVMLLPALSVVTPAIVNAPLSVISVIVVIPNAPLILEVAISIEFLSRNKT